MGLRNVEQLKGGEQLENKYVTIGFRFGETVALCIQGWL